MKKDVFKKGFTAIELLISVAVLIILISVIVYSFTTLKASQSMKNATQTVLTSIDKARSSSFASINSSTYGIHFQSDQVVIFTGTVYTAGTGSNEVMILGTPATISSVTLNGTSGTTGDVYFQRLTGVPSKTGTIAVTVGNRIKTITISATGGSSLN